MKVAGKRDLLIEIGCEELPARHVDSLASALVQGVTDALTRMGIAHGASRSYATPRRLAVMVADTTLRQADRLLEKRGPAVAIAFQDGRPTPAALGFARSCGVDISTLKRDKEHLVYRTTVRGCSTASLLPKVFESALLCMDERVPQRMRWGVGDETFSRPVRWLVLLYGRRVIRVEHFGLKAGCRTFGHRFHAPGPISLKAPEDYESALNRANVLADTSGRRETIRRKVELKAKEHGGQARITESLLSEVTALVEWPVVIAGRIDRRFLSLPSEIIVAAVETNQRYFTVFDRTQKLLPVFVAVVNIASKNMGEVVSGNERVIRPRLADALFFWDQDRKQPLSAYLDRLSGTSYQAALGDMRSRVERLQALVGHLAELQGENRKAAMRAAELCKCDLVTRMVGEFPELQGVIGAHYARADGEEPEVVSAISEHYLPNQHGAPIPSGRIGRCLALADRLDMLAGIFAVGQKPTANKDPYGLKRSALGVLRICIEGGLDVDVRQALNWAIHQQPAGRKDIQVADEIWEFIVERMRSYFLDRGATVEQFEAVRAVGLTQPLDFERRLQALRRFTGSPVAVSLAVADKRARNILRQAGFNGDLESSRLLLEQPAEILLAKEIEAADADLVSLRRLADYDAMFQRLSRLKSPVDAFFESVRVLDNDPVRRSSRLSLLRRLDILCREVADLSQISVP